MPNLITGKEIMEGDQKKRKKNRNDASSRDKQTNVKSAVGMNCNAAQIHTHTPHIHTQKIEGCKLEQRIIALRWHTQDEYASPWHLMLVPWDNTHGERERTVSGRISQSGDGYLLLSLTSK